MVMVGDTEVDMAAAADTAEAVPRDLRMEVVDLGVDTMADTLATARRSIMPDLVPPFLL